MSAFLDTLFNKAKSAVNKIEKKGFNTVLDKISGGAWQGGKMSSFSADSDESLLDVTMKRMGGFVKTTAYGMKNPLAMPVMMSVQPLLWCCDRLLNINEDSVIDAYEKFQRGEVGIDEVLDFLTNINYDSVLPKHLAGYMSEHMEASRDLVMKMEYGELTREDVYEYCNKVDTFKYSLSEFITVCNNASHDSCDTYDSDDYDEYEDDEYDEYEESDDYE